jgi:hypothetical protein
MVGLLPRILLNARSKWDGAEPHFEIGVFGGWNYGVALCDRLAQLIGYRFLQL